MSAILAFLLDIDTLTDVISVRDACVNAMSLRPPCPSFTPGFRMLSGSRHVHGSLPMTSQPSRPRCQLPHNTPLLQYNPSRPLPQIGTLSAFIVVCIAVLTLRYCPPMPQPPTSADSPGARWSLESGTSADAAATFLAPDDARDGPSVRSPAPHLAALRALRAHEAPVPFAAVPSSHWGARLRRAMRAVPNEWWIAAFTAGAFLTNLGAKASGVGFDRWFVPRWGGVRGSG